MTDIQTIERLCGQIHRDRVIASRVRWGVIAFFALTALGAGAWLLYEVGR